MKQPWQQQHEQLRSMQQQQEENMRRQQEEMRKRQEMGHWHQQQKEKEKLETPSRESITGKFAQVKAEATNLRQDMIATEANAGFRAFNEGDKDRREVDFIGLRRRLASGERWSEDLIQAVHPRATRGSRSGG